MFWALKGATLSPRREYQRHKAALRKDLPASLVQPRTITGRR
jgi:hypothetical protein